MANEKENKDFLDPVFLKYGMEVYSHEYIEKLREENLDLKIKGKKVTNLVPQAGFQERVACADADLLICGGKKGGGKATSNDSLIVTPFGLRRLGDLRVGDIISNPVTGGMQRVIQIFEHPHKDLYRVNFDDGTSCECCLDHLWKVRQTGYTKKSRMLNGGNIDSDYRIMTFAMIKQYLDEQEQGLHYMHTVKGQATSKKYLVTPVCAPVKFTNPGKVKLDTTLDPYIIGAILGDGCVTEKATEDYDALFCSDDAEIEEQFTKSGVDMTHFGRRNGGGETFKNYYIKDSRIRKTFTELNLYGCNSERKFIPYQLKISPLETRLALIQGLMDTDGCAEARGQVSFCSISKQLAEDVRFIIESLGGVVYTRQKEAGYRKPDGEYVRCNDAYELHIKIKNPSQLFRLKRKKDACKEFNGGISEVARRIESYEYVGKKDARCITVDGCDSLYMLQDFIVTHNTWVSLYKSMTYMFNPDVSMYVFRKYEDDIKRGPWKACKPIFRGFGDFKESSYEVSFLGGKGATLKMEHLADLGKIQDRFRGAEMPYIDIEELPEHTRDDLSIIFDCLSVNRNTAGVKSQVVATCNPVGQKNKLWHFLKWWMYVDADGKHRIDPAKDGKKRYMFKYGPDDSQIAWGNTWQEVYEHPMAKAKIDLLVLGRDDISPKDMIMSVQFIEGDYSDNKILQKTDKGYVARLASKGDGSVVNDLSGVWEDMEEASGLLSEDDINSFYNNAEKRDGVMRGSADVALSGDFMVLYALDGHHICDLEAWFGGFSDDVIPFIENFLRKNGIRKENFTFDANGLGHWIQKDSRFSRSRPFNNKSAPTDSRMWNNLKSESCDNFVHAIHRKEFSIEQSILDKHFTDKKGKSFTFRTRFMEERLALKRKDNVARFEIIEKTQMKLEVGHSPDFIEGLMMIMPLFEQSVRPTRKGFGIW